MTIKRLRAAVGAKPFQPLAICLAEGRRFLVRHPESVLIAPRTTRSFVIAGPKEEYRIINLTLVS
jgi:hypothetical protein